MWVPAVSYGGENCPGSIATYKDSFVNLGPNNKDLQVIASRVRKHLVFIGWKVESWSGGISNRMRYTSPSGEVCYSLRDICSRLVFPGDDIDTDGSRSRSPASFSDAVEKEEESEEPVTSKFSDDYHEESSEKIAQKYASIEIHVKSRHLTSQVRNSLSAVGWKFVDKFKKSKLKMEKVYISPNGKIFYSLRSACNWWWRNSGVLCNKWEEPQQIHEEEKDESNGRHEKKRKREEISHEHSQQIHEEVEFEDESNGRREKKRKREEISTDIGAHNNRQKSMLSKLIDSDSLLLGAKVQYRSKKDGPPLKEGQIYREGIKCFCCRHVFNVSKFEAHAGSKRHRPCESLFLEDGRSLMDCRGLLPAGPAKKQKKQPKNHNPTGENKNKNKNNDSAQHDFVCSVCREGGKLLMCDVCPSVFHPTCLGLKEIPDTGWYCPSCCCGFCGSIYEDGVEQSMHFVSCSQCQLKYHVGCLNKKGYSIGIDIDSEGNWFCSEGCQSIYSGLQELVGKSKPIHNKLGHSADTLTWTSFRRAKDAENGIRREIKRKLKLGLNVIQESFEPIREGGQDIVKSILYNKWSNLNRMNFQNFYTILLERDFEVITVATVRIHGKKVAELPLIATKLEYRGQGMCRTFMTEMEKKLVELGVERLILPASHHVVDTWINSFGFSEMNDSEKLGLRNHVFLNFPDTVMCHKLLGYRAISSVEN